MFKNLNVGFWLVLIFVFGFQAAIAQKSSPISPPLGPANFRSDVFGIGIRDLTEQVQDKIEGIVTSTNLSLIQDGINARLEFRSIRVYKPTKLATVYPDQPNQWFIQTPMNVHIEIVLPWHTSNRQLYIPIDVNASCEGWHTGNGVVQIVAYPQPISIEGGNIIEEILTIKNYVDSRVRNSIPQMTFTSVSTPFRCSTLGTAPGNDVNFQTGFIHFDLPVPPTTPSPVPNPAIEQMVEVTFVKLKRLRARDFAGSILYEPLENITLETFCNHTFRQASRLSMSENDEVYLSMSPVKIKGRTFDKMIVIANIKQQTLGSGIPDSNFEINYRSADFMPGIHTIKITKLFARRVGNATVFTRVDAYELTYLVRTSIIANS